ncbi:MAG: PHB depolymerase family esterase [Candidatus Acidiferrales bacterium]
MRKLALIILCVFLVAILTFRMLAGEKFSLESGGRTRTYSLHTPKDYTPSKRWPVIFLIHGAGGQGTGMARVAHFDDFAERNGIIAVYPDGVDRRWADGRGTTTPEREGVNDVAFFSALLDKLEATYSVDPSRVYATGLSNGGFMSFKLACDLSARIAAVAPVAATFSLRLSQECHPARPISVLEINGTSDPLVPYEGGGMMRGSGGQILSALDSAKAWAKIDGCAETPATDSLAPKSENGLETRHEIYSGCRGGTEVALYSIVGGGHTWPGGMQYAPQFFIGKTSRDFDANETIWKFFQAHPLPAAKP